MIQDQRAMYKKVGYLIMLCMKGEEGKINWNQNVFISEVIIAFVIGQFHSLYWNKFHPFLKCNLIKQFYMLISAWFQINFILLYKIGWVPRAETPTYLSWSCNLFFPIPIKLDICACHNFSVQSVSMILKHRISQI